MQDAPGALAEVLAPAEVPVQACSPDEPAVWALAEALVPACFPDVPEVLVPAAELVPVATAESALDASQDEPAV